MRVEPSLEKKKLRDFEFDLWHPLTFPLPKIEQ